MIAVNRHYIPEGIETHLLYNAGRIEREDSWEYVVTLSEGDREYYETLLDMLGDTDSIELGINVETGQTVCDTGNVYDVAGVFDWHEDKSLITFRTTK